MSRNPHFDAVLERMRGVHDSKNEDYAEASNPYSNFEGAAHIANIDTEQVFLTLIGIKVERLRQLVGKSKHANYESPEDTILDLANYAALWLSLIERDNSLNADTGIYRGDSALSGFIDASVTLGTAARPFVLGQRISTEQSVTD